MNVLVATGAHYVVDISTQQVGAGDLTATQKLVQIAITTNHQLWLADRKCFGNFPGD
jgi:hypothetical protein